MTTYDGFTYDETTCAALLDAGAVLPPGTTGREDADVLTARTYTHPALDERRIVRLVPGTLGEAEDLALDFLGLAREPETREVGQVRRETLGFPAWALVNDPANGHHALALVKDVERLARQAKSRPGTAKEGFEALGDRLGRAVPHFLPTFYEQAARVFLQHENTTYAAAFFGKARAAERVHALTVDEERQRAVFLEFAFAGALTVKALKEHVKALAARLTPADAWAQFRQLTVERCAAGMPPYASLPQDARALIKAAGLDRVTAECALVGDLLASPAAVRAPASFWNTYRATLVVLAGQQSAVRARLLEIMPAGLGRTTEDDEFWLALLAETGADLLLTGETQTADGTDAADWLTRWSLYRKHGGNVCDRSPATLALVERMAPLLRERGRPVDLFTGRWHAGADAFDVSPLLGNTLRAGIPDELGWPALDEALRRLDAETRSDRDDTLAVHEAWPALILSRRHKAIVVGPQDILLEHDLRLPDGLDKWQRPSFRHTDGELLVMWRQDNKQYGYWSARPAEVFPLDGEKLPHWYGGGAGETSIPLPDGGRATGGRALHAGDTVLPPARRILGDGTSYWRSGRHGTRQVWLEYDPATGTHGRASLPAFLNSGIRDGATLLQHQCVVLPLQPGLEDSPFGTDGTVLGRWVRTEREGDETRTTVGTPDGRTVTLTAADGRIPGVPLGALRLPGGVEPVVVAQHRHLALYTTDAATGPRELGRLTPLERGGEFAAGTRLVPPADFWHALRPRDENASALLRALSDEQAEELLRVGAVALTERLARIEAAGATTGSAKPDVPTADKVVRDAVARALPALTEPHLLTGVAALVHAVLRFAVSVDSFVTPPVERPRTERKRAEGMFADYSPEDGDDQTLREATSQIAHLHGWWGGARNWSTLRQIRAVNHVLSGEPADGAPLSASSRPAGTADGWRSDEFTVPGIAAVWPSVLGVLRPLAYRASCATLTEEHRRALLLLFEAITEGPLAAPGAALREVTLSEPNERQERNGQVLRREGRTVVVLGRQNVDHRTGRVNWLALDHDPAGVFGAVAHFTLEREKAYPPVFPADALAAVTGLIRDKGPAPWQPEATAALSAATRDGLGPVQAALLLAGEPSQLTDEVAAATGLKPRQKQLGDALLGSLEDGDLKALIGALLPDNPGDLWTTGPDTGAVGRVWAERLDGVVRLPEDLAGELTLAGLSTGSVEQVLNPHRTPWMSRTTVQRPDKDGNLAADDPQAVPGRYSLTHAVAALAGLAYALPYGHPLRAALPDALTVLRHRLTDPGLLVDLDLEWTEKGTSTAVELRKAYGLPATGGADEHGLTPVGEALVLRPWYGDQEAVLLRTSALTTADDPLFGLMEGLVGEGRRSGIRALRTILDDELARALAAGTDPEGPAGYAQDPAMSVPGLVAEVAGAHGLSEDAAVLYLQLLALPDPTDRNRARWTGWKPARAKKARTELAATGLVVEAKRARAGRTLFLPCGWLELKSPALPVELWKRGLHPVEEHARAVPPMPVPELFTRAWERVRAGDAPAYEELTTRATRKGRRR
ncbi:hypothetical protein [Streptomyces edwardsiae]|uniref:DNA-binding protein n=1 Tax=Streptomyces edwardsiae TaxID=3075527 RepID=A0ABU2Q0B9_9ACTN|nr:hypothetical protein [Streptomyces sp. DSM 41636]MDT0397872.1 hypothetical protein [Streptomyces sp. DSM 41636]